MSIPTPATSRDRILSEILAPVLDQNQLASIESVHRGFLYQHLYVAGALLDAREANATLVVTERDEDVEVASDGAHLYLQIKTRSRPLAPSDIDGMADRFDSIRAAHGSGERSGTASFILLSNTSPGRALKAQIESSDWPSDVAVIWPGSPASTPPGLPPAWPSLSEALAWCVTRARGVPNTRLEPETLVLKLAALAQHAAAGGALGGLPHAFQISELPRLFEQITREIQPFPQAPTLYYAHDQEPPLDLRQPVRLIVGLSGAGKGAWGARLAATTTQRSAYFDAIGAGDGGLASAVAQQLVAAFLGSNPEAVAAVQFPGASGQDSIRALGIEVARAGLDALVVIDNAHAAPPEQLLLVTQAAPQIQWVLLAQPGPTAEAVVARLGIAPEQLLGWPADTIAAVFAELGSPADAAAIERVRRLTSGLPLFVQSAARMATDSYAGDVGRLCGELEAASHLERTPQEVILEQSLLALSLQRRAVAEVLAIASIPLDSPEVDALAQAVGIEEHGSAARAVRDLVRWGIGRRSGAGRIQLHDAYRVPVLSAGTFTTAQRAAVATRLVQLLDESLERGFELQKLRRYLSALAEAGQFERLAQIMGNASEQILELGLARYAEGVLREYSGRDDIASEHRFWILDALAFWCVQAGRVPAARAVVADMDTIARENALGQRASEALLMKHLHLSALEGDVRGMASLTERPEVAGMDASTRRVFRYNIAVGLFTARQYDEVEKVTSELVPEYYDELGLDPFEIVGVNPLQIAEMLAQTEHDPDDLKRLADCLDLYARARSAVGLPSGLARVHAVKFYQLGQAFTSAVKTGQDFVEEVVSNLKDPPAARQFMENTLLPIVRDLELHDHMVPVGLQYAVVLAYAGDIAAARAQLERLRPYAEGAPPELRAEFRRQAAIVEGAARRNPFLTSSAQALIVSSAPAIQRVVGRNDECPCGSGRKFKRCCGDPRQRNG